MSRPIAGVEGTITSWGSTNFYSRLLAAMGPMSFAAVISQDVADVTQLNSTAQNNLGMLKSWTAVARGYSSTTAFTGNVGLIVVNAGTAYNLHVYSTNITTETVATHDITAQNKSDTLGTGTPYWKRFMPDYSKWRAEVEVGLDTGTGLASPLDTGTGTPVDLTFTYGTSMTLRSTCILSNVRTSIERGQQDRATLTYEGTSGLICSGGIFSGGETLGIPVWSDGTTTPGAIVGTAYSGRTFSGYDSFWERINIRTAMGEPGMVEVGIRGSGKLTIA